MSGDGHERRARGGARAGRRLDGQAAAAFIAALEQGATVRAAAKAAGCSAGTCYNRRRTDPGFRAAWDDAAAKANRPWLIATRNGRRLQKWKPRGVKFTAERKAIYLAHFAATCDSDEAARLAGVGDTTVYMHLRTDPGFAAARAEALDQGYARLEAELARQRLAALKRYAAAIDAASPDPEAAVEFERALKLLKRYDLRRGRPEPLVRPRGDAQRPSFGEAMARLEKRLTALGYEIDEDAVEPRGDDEEAA